MRRRTRWLRRLLVIIPVGIVLIWLALRLVLPVIVRNQVTAALNSLGLANVQFRLTRASLWGARIEDLSAGNGQWLQMERAEIAYSPARAMAGRVNSLRLRGLRVTFDLDKPPTLRAPSQAPSTDGELPVDAVELESCVVALRRGGRWLELPLTGHLQREAPGQARFHLGITSAAGALRVTGEMTAGGIEATVQARGVELSQALPLLMGEAADQLTRGGERLDADLQIVGGHELRVRRALVAWAGGQIEVEPFALNLTRPIINLALSARQIELDRVLQLATDGQAVATGAFSGRVALMIDWPGVRIGQGRLGSDGGGTLRLASSLDAFSRVLDASDPRFARDQQMRRLKQQILEAVQDFQYDHLSADLARGDDGLLVAVRIQGRGRTGARQPLDVALNYRGLEEGLNAYLAARSRVLTGGR